MTNILIKDNRKDETYFVLCKNRIKENTLVTYCSHYNKLTIPEHLTEFLKYTPKEPSSYYTIVFDINDNVIFVSELSWASNLTIKFAKEFIKNGELSESSIKDLIDKEIESVIKSNIASEKRAKEISDSMKNFKGGSISFGDGLFGIKV